MALLLAAAACSGGSGDSGGSAAPTTVGTSASGATDATPPPSFTGSGKDAYCALADTYTGAMTRFFEPGSTGDVRALYQGAATAARDAIRVAPAEIKPDVQVVADTMTALVDGLEKVNYDIPRLPRDVIARLMAPEFVVASTRLSTYARDVCGLAG